jgi:hypothetical protein
LTTKNLKTLVIHYSPLTKRRDYIEKTLSGQLKFEFITEGQKSKFTFESTMSNGAFGVSTKKIAMDLGVNSRTRIKSRRQSRIEGWVYLAYSGIPWTNQEIILGSLPPRVGLEEEILEVTQMHLRALERGVEEGVEWLLVLEDDAILTENFSRTVNSVTQRITNKPIWINLNSGAGLGHTSSDPMVDACGLFRVKPASTKCATAYLINKSYMLKSCKVLSNHGVPTWLPIDNIYQVINRRIRARSYWSHPEVVIQGSESGKYKSNLDKRRW